MDDENRFATLLKQYREKFNDYPAIFDLDASEVLSKMEKAIRTGKPLVEPKGGLV